MPSDRAVVEGECGAPAAGEGRCAVPDEPAGAGSGADLARTALAAARQATRQRSGSGVRSGRGGTGRGGAARGSANRDRTGLGGVNRGGYSGSGPDVRDPQLFGTMVGRLLADRGWEGTAATAAVLSRWDAIVGYEVASHCQPVSLRDGELTVAAESTAWATQLRLLVPRLLGRIRAEVGPDVVGRVRVHGPTAPTWTRGPRRVVGRGPRDTYG